jgi:hypothetical protein
MAELLYNVSLEGYWVDVSKRIWKTKDDELYHIDPSGRAVKYVENVEDINNNFSDITFSFVSANSNNESEEVPPPPSNKKTKVI